MATGTAERPVSAHTEIRKIHQEGQRRLPITHGWYMRGKKLPGGAFEPEAGLPGDVFVYLDMGDPWVRELYQEKGFLMLSEALGGTANVDAEFVVRPPKLEVLEKAMALLRETRPRAIAAIEEELEEIKEALSQPAGLTGGEAASLRRKRAGLKKRIEMIKDDGLYDARAVYRQCVQERQAVVRSQIPEAQVIALQLEREEAGWAENLRQLDLAEEAEKAAAKTKAARSTASTSE